MTTTPSFPPAPEGSTRTPTSIIGESMVEWGGYQEILSEAVGQLHLDGWEAGYRAAIEIAEYEGAVALVQTLRAARENYWKDNDLSDDGGPDGGPDGPDDFDDFHLR